VELLYETVVTPDQIDHLGHMNVQFYAVAARAGAEAKLAALGLVADDRQVVVEPDIYVRHHREQLVGSPLAVNGGVLDVFGDRIRLYEELVNADTGDVAATFVLSFALADRATRAPRPIGTSLVEAALASTVTVPEHGRPRSISLDEDPIDRPPSLDVLRERELAMRQVRVIGAAETDEDGFTTGRAIPELVWGGVAVPGREFQPLEPLAGGGQMGFATMETRATWARPARIGDRLQSFGAEVDIQTKTMLGRHWLFDVDRGELVAVFSLVNLAFDLTSRRAIAFPDDVRRRIERRHHPDLVALDPA
jgi:acyl-CoA thioester hydrolase